MHGESHKYLHQHVCVSHTLCEQMRFRCSRLPFSLLSGPGSKTSLRDILLFGAFWLSVAAFWPPGGLPAGPAWCSFALVNGQHDCAPTSFHPCSHLPPPIAPLFLSLAFTLSLSLVLAVVAATVVVAVVAAVFAAASFSGPRKTKGQGQGASSRAGKGKKGHKGPARGKKGRALTSGMGAGCAASELDARHGNVRGRRQMTKLCLDLSSSSSLQMTKLSNSDAQAP